MKNLYWYLLLLSFASIVLYSFSSFDQEKSVSTFDKNELSSTNDSVQKDSNHSEFALYKTLNLEQLNLSEKTFQYAIKGYENLKTQAIVKDTQYLSIVDFSQSSRQKRFYLFDFKTHQLVRNTFVAHGKNSGIDMATTFSNSPGSEQSSLGFYVTKGTYNGKNGLSLKMSGLEKGYNDNAEKRAIVVHGADYVNVNRTKSAYMGRSQGCPALPKIESLEIINLIKDGSPLFVYSDDKEYLQSSDLLNS